MPGALPSPAPETQVSAHWSPASDDDCLLSTLRSKDPIRDRNRRGSIYFYRFAEKTAEELKKLREELAKLTEPE